MREREGAWEGGKEKKGKSKIIQVWCKYRNHWEKNVYRAAILP